jgi:TonB family protein
VALAVVVSLGADQAAKPALYQSGSIPLQPVNSVEVGGGEVVLEVSVDKTGAVTGMKTLRETAAFTARTTAAVKTWRFSPAEAPIAEARRKPGGPTTQPVESKVLVAALFRRPSITSPTLGDPVKDIGAASNDIPYPTSVITPPFPISALSPGVVLVEVSLDAKGAVTGAGVRVPAAGFNSAALDAAKAWKFRPASPGGVSAPSVAYLLFAFAVPRN